MGSTKDLHGTEEGADDNALTMPTLPERNHKKKNEPIKKRLPRYQSSLKPISLSAVQVCERNYRRHDLQKHANWHVAHFVKECIIHGTGPNLHHHYCLFLQRLRRYPCQYLSKWQRFVLMVGRDELN
jgi:hypothetical protein